MVVCTWKDILSDQIFTDDQRSPFPQVRYFSGNSRHVLQYLLTSTGSERKQEETSATRSFALCIRKCFEFCSINGIVFADVHIIGIRTRYPDHCSPEYRKRSYPQRCDLIDLAVLLRFPISFFGPLSGDNIICHPVSLGSWESLQTAVMPLPAKKAPYSCPECSSDLSISCSASSMIF